MDKSSVFYLPKTENLVGESDYFYVEKTQTVCIEHQLF